MYTHNIIQFFFLLSSNRSTNTCTVTMMIFLMPLKSKNDTNNTCKTHFEFHSGISISHAYVEHTK